MKTSLVKVLFYAGMACSILTGVFFILHNAEWLIGDDSLACSHTGWGIPFSLSGFIIPETSRFYPMAYMMYNILLWIGAYSITAHFTLHAIIFVILVVLFSILCRFSLTNNQLTNWDYIIILAASIIVISRVFGSFVTTEYTMWVDFFMLVILLLCTFYVHEKHSIWALIFGIISMTYFVFCLEVNFILLLSYGICGVLFSWKQLSKVEKSYLFSMIGIALLYLVLYYFLVYIHKGTEPYDASHGSNDSFLVNAIKMFYAQKILIVALVLLCLRLYMIFKKRHQYSWYDTLLLAGFGLYLGCCILKLNHTIYYYMSMICVFPSVLHYLRIYIKPKWTAFAMIILAVVMCRNFPNKLINSANARVEATAMWNLLKEQYTDGAEFYFYSPHSDMVNTNEYLWRDQREHALEVLLGYKVNNKQLKIKHIETFSSEKGVYILPKLNDILVPNSNQLILNNGELLSNSCGISIVKIDTLR